ncbi:hypothetical protein ACSTK0_25130, partial [Vibrio parahaemolyticus]
MTASCFVDALGRSAGAASAGRADGSSEALPADVAASCVVNALGGRSVYSVSEVWVWDCPV